MQAEAAYFGLGGALKRSSNFCTCMAAVLSRGFRCTVRSANAGATSPGQLQAPSIRARIQRRRCFPIRAAKLAKIVCQAGKGMQTVSPKAAEYMPRRPVRIQNTHAYMHKTGRFDSSR